MSLVPCQNPALADGAVLKSIAAIACRLQKQTDLHELVFQWTEDGLTAQSSLKVAAEHPLGAHLLKCLPQTRLVEVEK